MACVFSIWGGKLTYASPEHIFIFVLIKIFIYFKLLHGKDYLFSEIIYFHWVFFKKWATGAPGWLSQLSGQLLILAQVMISQLWVWAPRWAPYWQHGACLGFSLSPSLSALTLLIHMSALSLKIKKNIYILKILLQL